MVAIENLEVCKLSWNKKSRCRDRNKYNNKENWLKIRTFFKIVYKNKWFTALEKCMLSLWFKEDKRRNISKTCPTMRRTKW